MEEIIVRKGNRKISINVKRLGFIGKGVGLTFKSLKTNSLLFDFRRDVRVAITSLFVFFPFLIVWLDDKNKCIDAKIVRPWVISLRPKKSFRRFIEVPINAKNAKIIDFFVGKRKRFKY